MWTLQNKEVGVYLDHDSDSQSTNQVCTHMTLVTAQLLNAFATGLAEVNSLTSKQKF
jgi:hypothetical protein